MRLNDPVCAKKSSRLQVPANKSFENRIHGYPLDLWVDAWRRKVACGDVIIVRYADDVVRGFELKEDAERFLREVRERLAQFGLELHPEYFRKDKLHFWS
jgi:hypothetical protein